MGAGQVTDVTEILAAGGAWVTTVTPSLNSVPIGTSQAWITWGSPNVQNDLLGTVPPSTKLWTVGPSSRAGFSPGNAAASTFLP